jgi:hypothetical protein
MTSYVHRIRDGRTDGQGYSSIPTTLRVEDKKMIAHISNRIFVIFVDLTDEEQLVVKKKKKNHRKS